MNKRYSLELFLIGRREDGFEHKPSGRNLGRCCLSCSIAFKARSIYKTQFVVKQKWLEYGIQMGCLRFIHCYGNGEWIRRSCVILFICIKRTAAGGKFFLYDFKSGDGLEIDFGFPEFYLFRLRPVSGDL
jgi:hypothetical protein